MYYTNFIGFGITLKTFRECSADYVQSLARFPIPFAMQSRICGKFNLGWGERDARMVYIDLKAYLEKYDLHPNGNSFEIS